VEELIIALFVAIYEAGAWVVKRVRRAWRRWQERRRAERDAATPPARQVPGPVPEAARSAEAELESARQGVAAQASDLACRAAAAEAELARSRATEPLAGLVRQAVKLRAEDIRRAVTASTADSLVVAQHAAEVAWLDNVLARVTAWGRLRSGPPQGELLLAVDRAAGDLAVALGAALPGLRLGTAVAVPGPISAEERELGRQAGLLLVPVAPAAGESPGAWVSVALTVSHAFLAAQPAIQAELARHLDLPPGPHYLPAYLDPAEEEALIALPVAAGLGVLLADLVATALLGPAYAATLAAALARPDLPRAVSRLGVEPGAPVLSALPPPVLRVGVVAAALGHLGFAMERDAVLAAWRQAHRRLRSMSYPSELQGWLEVPLTAWDGLIDRLALAGLTTPLAALGGPGLAGLPGLAWSSERQAAAAQASTQLLQLRPPSVEPRVALAAALLAQGAEPDRGAALLRPLLVALAAPAGPAPRREALVTEPDAPLLDPAGLDPRLVREALILSAILERRGRAFGRRRTR
jgi:hypothetical protein